MEYAITLIIVAYAILTIAISLNINKNRNQKMIGFRGSYYTTYLERYPYYVRVVVKKYRRNFLFYNIHEEEKEYQYSEDYRETDQYYRLKAIREHEIYKREKSSGE